MNLNISNNGTAANPIRNIDGVVIEVQADGNTDVATISNNVIEAPTSGRPEMTVGADATQRPRRRTTCHHDQRQQHQRDRWPGHFRPRPRLATMDAHILNNTVAAHPTNAARAGIRVDPDPALTRRSTWKSAATPPREAPIPRRPTRPASICASKVPTPQSTSSISRVKPVPNRTPTVRTTSIARTRARPALSGSAGTALLAAQTGFTTTGAIFTCGRHQCGQHGNTTDSDPQPSDPDHIPPASTTPIPRHRLKEPERPRSGQRLDPPR